MPTLNARKQQDIAAVIKAAREDAGISLGKQLRWNVQRLLAGVEISEPKRR